MKKFITLFIVVLFNCLLFSQLRQILVLNEGAYDYTNSKIVVPVSVGSFDPVKRIYTKLNEIDGARFASDIRIDGSVYWVAADKNLVKYDLNTHQKLNEYTLEGIRKIAFYNNLLIVTRGEYLKTFGAYVQIYNKNTFELLFEIPFSELPYTTESVFVKQGIAFIGVNNGFDFGNEVGKIVKIDLDNLKVIETIDLGIDGKNPENLMLKDDLLISLNNKNYTGSSVSLIETNGTSVSTYNLANVNSLCGTSTLVGDIVVYQESGKMDINSFEISSKQSGFLKNLGKSFYGMSYDPISKYLCAAETDFRTTGIVYIYDVDFNELFKFDAGVTPGYFAFDNSAAVQTKQINQLEFEISPDPVVSNLTISSKQSIDEVQVMDFYGREIIRTDKLSVNLEGVQAGTYILMVKSKEKVTYRRFVKAGN